MAGGKTVLEGKRGERLELYTMFSRLLKAMCINNILNSIWRSGDRMQVFSFCIYIYRHGILHCIQAWYSVYMHDFIRAQDDSLC